jgi:hypothetical protein
MVTAAYVMSVRLRAASRRTQRKTARKEEITIPGLIRRQLLPLP